MEYGIDMLAAASKVVLCENALYIVFSFSVLRGWKGTTFQQGVKVRKKAEGYSSYDENISKPAELAPYGVGIQME